MTYDKDSTTMKLFIFRNKGSKCPLCTTDMQPVRNGAAWCGSCGTLGEIYIQSGKYEYIRFFTPEAMKDENQADA